MPVRWRFGSKPVLASPSTASTARGSSNWNLRWWRKLRLQPPFPLLCFHMLGNAPVVVPLPAAALLKPDKIARFWTGMYRSSSWPKHPDGPDFKTLILSTTIVACQWHYCLGYPSPALIKKTFSSLKDIPRLLVILANQEDIIEDLFLSINSRCNSLFTIIHRHLGPKSCCF